jgi:DNA-binding MarR family transcriptional regulator
MFETVVLTPSLVDNSGYLLHRATVRARECAIAHVSEGRHPREFAVMTGLISLAPCSQRELADHLRVNPTVMVQVIDSLEADGLVERARNPRDRRSYALRLTAAGLDAIAAMDADVASAAAMLVERLSAVERTRLNELLREVVGPAQRALPETLTDRTGFLVFHAHLRARELADAALAPLGILVRHYGALSAVMDATAGVSQQDVARRLGVSGPVAMQLVDHLEQRGLLERRRNPRDRRSYELAPTARGRSAWRDARDLLTATNAELMAPIGPEGGRELRVLLRKLIGVGEPESVGDPALADRAP